MKEYLAFVKKIGTTLDGKYIYEFLFTTVPDSVWGNNFNIVPAGIIPNLIPDFNTLSKKGRVITDINFKLATESTCFSMMDCIDGIIALCFSEAGFYNDLKFMFGETYDDVILKLKEQNLELNEIEKITIDEDGIINDAIKKLEDNNYNDDFE